MGLSFNPEFADSLDEVYVAGRKTVSTSEVLAAASTSNATGRQTVIVYNTSTDTTVYFGPTGFTTGISGTGIPIFPGSIGRLDFTLNNNVYLKTDSGSADVVIHEAG